MSPRLVHGGRASFAYVDDISVSVVDVPRWTEASVIDYVAEITELGQGVASAAALTDFRGAMIGPRERRRVVDWLEERGLGAQTRACLLADNMLLRGAVTAYAWMSGTEGRAFPRSEYRRACA